MEDSGQAARTHRVPSCRGRPVAPRASPHLDARAARPQLRPYGRPRPRARRRRRARPRPQPAERDAGRGRSAVVARRPAPPERPARAVLDVPGGPCPQLTGNPSRLSHPPATLARMAPERLSPDVRRLVLGNTLSALGTGFTLPFLLIYLNKVRGFSLPTAGYVVAALALVGLGSVAPMGALSDRIGPWRVLVFALLC